MYTPAALIASSSHKVWGMNEATPLFIGSVSKTFLACPVYHQRISPQTKVYKGITIHQLLTHSSGYNGTILTELVHFSNPEKQYKKWREDFYTELSKTEQQFIPGKYNVYSNVGYTLLAFELEKLLNKSYVQYMSAFFSDLHLLNTQVYYNHVGSGDIQSCLDDIRTLAKWIFESGAYDFLSTNGTKDTTFGVVENYNVTGYGVDTARNNPGAISADDYVLKRGSNPVHSCVLQLNRNGTYNFSVWKTERPKLKFSLEEKPLGKITANTEFEKGYYISSRKNELKEITDGEELVTYKLNGKTYLFYNNQVEYVKVVLPGPEGLSDSILKKANVCDFNGYYLVTVNGKRFIFDYTLKSPCFELCGCNAKFSV
jgi:hypothetical protein